jgi:CubicO group peptidase (beta-lactamase class C family)
MISMSFRRLFATLMLLAVAACRPADPYDTTVPVVAPGPLAGRLDAYLSSLVEEGFSGIAAVSTPDGLVLLKGYGLADDSTGAPVTPATVLGTGSITKQFTAAAILRLEMDGLLSTRNSIGTYFEGIPEGKASITLHHLLTHTAGFRGAIGDDYEAVGRTDYVRRALDSELLFEPGTAYEYSNVGYSLLAAIIEQVTGESYEAYLNSALFEPAGMRRTGYVIPGFAERDLAVGYRGGRRWGRLTEHAWAADGPYWNLRGNGGILSTAGDMLRWDRALKGDDILSDAAKEKLYGRHVREYEDGDSWYGYGWVTWPTPRGTRLVSHNGGNGIFYADFLRFLDEDVTIFVATNRATRAAGRLGWTIADLVFDSAQDSPPPAWRPQPITDFQDTASGRTARRVVEILAFGTPGDLAALVDTMMAPGFRDMAPLEDHLRILGTMQADLVGRSIAEIRSTGRMFEVDFAREGTPDLTLMIETGPGDPALVQGLGLGGR